MNDSVNQLELLLRQKLGIAEEMRELIFYMEYAMEHEDVDRISDAIDAREIKIQQYEEVETAYIEVLEMLAEQANLNEEELLKKYEIEDLAIQILDIFKLLYDKNQEFADKMTKMQEKSKSDLKNLNISKRATSGYFNTTGIQGRQYDNKR